MNPLPQIRLLTVAQLVTGVLGSLAAGAVWGAGGAASFAGGVVIILTSVLSLAWVGWRVFAQKSVAWTVVAIISKYALFLSSIYYLTRTAWFNVAAGGLGIASFVIPALVVAVFTQEKESSRGGSSF